MPANTLNGNSISVKVISDGTYQLDGGVVCGPLVRPDWSSVLTPDRQNRVRLGLNCLLIKTPQANILVNTGVGRDIDPEERERYGCSTSRLQAAMKKHGVRPNQIDYVVLSHLHFDHSGGATRRNSYNNLVAEYPEAKYVIQRSAWEECQNRHLDERSMLFYGPLTDGLEMLEANDRIMFVEGDHQLVPGVDIIMSGGYSAGHSIVVVNAGSERYGYLADLVPTRVHLKVPCITNYDMNPQKTMKDKKAILARAHDEGWLLVFAHGHKEVAGYLTHENRLQPVDVS